MKAPPAFASFGIISGTGFAMVNMIGLGAMDFIISFVTRLPLETPMKTSAPLRASARVPCTFRGFVRPAMDFFTPSKSLRLLLMIPLLSQMITSFAGVHMPLSTPTHSRSFATAMPAAPAPESTIFMLSSGLPATFDALISAASMTIAVPCWSSWNTGIPISCSRSSISKHLGAEISSRFMPPNAGAMAFTMRIISSGSFVSRHIGKPSTPPNCLKSMALPSITGNAASGPMSPRPSTAVPSVTTATELDFMV